MKIESPIFIIGSPRSGTSMLFQMLQRHEFLWSLYTEGQIWNIISNTRWGKKGEYSTKKDCTDEIVKEIYEFYLTQTKNKEGNINNPFRIIDKTPLNCLKIDCINKIFPDALYIFIYRDGRNVIHSMLDIWKQDEKWFPKAEIPKYLNPALHMPDGTIENRVWGPIPPGWRLYLNKRMVDLCAWQWIELNKIALNSFKKIKNHVYMISHEKFIENPKKYLQEICEFTNLPWSEEFDRHLNDIRKIDSEKWKTKYSEDIISVYPKIKNMMYRLGYIK